MALELRSKYQINVFAIALGGEISRLKQLTGAANRVLTGKYFLINQDAFLTLNFSKKGS